VHQEPPSNSSIKMAVEILRNQLSSKRAMKKDNQTDF